MLKMPLNPNQPHVRHVTSSFSPKVLQITAIRKSQLMLRL